MHADLTGLSSGPFNELVVDATGNAYVNGGQGSVVSAHLDYAPDGICADADGAIWVATVPGKRCTRVAEGGDVLDTVAVDRGRFACMPGGENGRTLFIGAAEWRAMEAAMGEGPGQTGQLLAATGQPAPHAGHP